MTRKRTAANGEGTIGQRKKGRHKGKYEAAITIGRKPDGRLDRVHQLFERRADADAWLQEQKRQRDSGTLKRSNTTVAVYLDFWLENVVKPDRAPATYDAYRSMVRNHLIPELGTTPLDKLTAAQVQALKARKRAQERPLSARTVEYMLIVLRAALSLAKRWGMVNENVAASVSLPRSPRRQARTLDRAQSRAFVEAIRTDRLYALYVTDLLLGLRRGEIVGLRWQDVDLDGGQLVVAGALKRSSEGQQRGDPKTESSRREIALPRVLVTVLRAHHARQLAEREAHKHWRSYRDTDYVFTTSAGGPIDPQRLTALWRELRTKAGLPLDMHFHDLRHSVATMLLEEGVDIKMISRLLGHANSQITRDVYIRHTDRLKRQTADKMDELFGSIESSTAPPDAPPSDAQNKVS